MTIADLSALAHPASRLSEDEIHVWRLAHQRPDGRLPLRRVLAAYLDSPVEEVQLTDDEHGRPTLVDGDGSLGFNWSHSGGFAMIAVGRGVVPGIDMELMGRRTRTLELARRYFSADEVAYLDGLAPTRRAEAFLELWTTKEAVLKAVGRGIAYGLDRLSITVSDTGLRLSRLDGDSIAAWRLRRLRAGEDVIAALAWRGPDRRVRVGRLDLVD